MRKIILVIAYFDGEGVEQDYAEAVKWYRLAAEQGDAVAQNNLGYAYRNGAGVEQDYVEAVNWYRLAAEQGDAHAQLNLGDAFYNGEIVEQDYVEAVKWYRLAAEQGMPMRNTISVLPTTTAKVLSKTSPKRSNGGKWQQSKAMKLLSNWQKSACAKNTKTAEF